MIETRGSWSSDSGIYSLAQFKADYLPAVHDGTLLWLRRDVLQGLADRGMTAASVRPGELLEVRYTGDRRDVWHLNRFPAVMVLGR